jgi:transcriptional regulator with XRE-family HTH domain
MRSKVAERILATTPEEVKIFARLYGDLVVKIHGILKEKGYSQKLLAEKLDKKPSEIHKWLSGEHNFTLRSIAKLQAELGESLLEVPGVRQERNFEHTNGRTTFKVYVNKPKLLGKPVWKNEVFFEPENGRTDVG